VSRSSPGAERVTAVLSFLAAHPDQSFSLSELAGELELSVATAHALLYSLVAEGYLVRGVTDRRYALGPALIEVGDAARRRQGPLLDFVRAGVELLARDLGGLQCLATQRIGRQYAVVARAGASSVFGMTVQIGQRLTFGPPMHAIYVAWADEDTIRDWLRDIARGSSERAVEQCRQALARIREHGYIITLAEREGLPPVYRKLRGTPPTARPDFSAELSLLMESHYFLDTLEKDQTYQVSHIGAPVFDADGQVVVSLSAVFFGEPVTGSDLIAAASQIAGAGTRITTMIGGHTPDTPDGRARPAAR
jgi:DNA-binding IclR family transcriptional regulator